MACRWAMLGELKPQGPKGIDLRAARGESPLLSVKPYSHTMAVELEDLGLYQVTHERVT
jgi:hypothetical protein